MVWPGHRWKYVLFEGEVGFGYPTSAINSNPRLSRLSARLEPPVSICCSLSVNTWPSLTGSAFFWTAVAVFKDVESSLLTESKSIS